MPHSAITEKDERLRQALDAMPHKVWIVRTGRPPVYYNPAMRCFAGAALALPDRPSRERALIHPVMLSDLSKRELRLLSPRTTGL